METDPQNTCLNILGKRSEYHPILTNSEVQVLKVTLAEKPTIGWLPVKEDRPIHYQARVVASSLSTPDVGKVTYKLNNNQLLINYNIGGYSDKLIIPLETLKFNSQGEYKFFCSHINAILNCLVGNVVITIYERGIFITQLNKTHSLMYMVGVV